MRIFGEPRGSLLTNVVIAVSLISLGVSSLVVIDRLNKARRRDKDTALAHDALVLQLDALINLPSTSTDLTATTPATPHTAGDFTWEVIDLTPRLKKIVLRTPLAGSVPPAATTVAQIGFRYDDF